MKSTASLAAFALMLSAGGALAADLPARKAPPLPPAPPPPLWSGFYVGLNAGYGFGGSNGVTTATSAWDQYASTYFTTWAVPNLAGTFGAIQAANSGQGSANLSGFAGGGQIGYNYQWGSSVLIGLEADIQGATMNGSGSYAGAAVDSYRMGRMNMPHADRQVFGYGNVQASLDWFGTVRGRLGYLVTPTLLVYGTGGLTYGGATVNANYVSVTNWINTGMLNYPYSQTGFGSGNASTTLVGWNAGGGLEWLFTPNWSLKAEAFYYDLGNLTVQGYANTPASGLPAQMGAVIGEAQGLFPHTRVNVNGVIARAGVNYHFNWGASAPVIAKY
ncbi:porin family protein [Methylocystis echinoides]|uniref:outer membrane protein n=1 Tax=Methylocystis echinoides TaxID=29468 RepID=UPI003436D565